VTADPLATGSVEELTRGVIRLPLGEGSRWVWGSTLGKVCRTRQSSVDEKVLLMDGGGTKEKVQARNRPLGANLNSTVPPWRC